jgi:hypothetical protein
LYGKWLHSPVDKRQGIAKLGDPLKMNGVAGHQLELVLQGDGRDERIAEQAVSEENSESPLIQGKDEI